MITPEAQIPAAPKPKRMTLSAIKTGRLQKPTRIMIYSVDGCGKTTFASQAPKPIFLASEDGTAQFDVARFPSVETWADMLDGVQELTVGEHDYQTLVIDSLDWAEPLLWRSISDAAKVPTIEDVGGGFGKGYMAAMEGWRVLLAALERLQRDRGMGLILIGHSLIKKFANPEGDDYDRYSLKLNEKAAGLIREWVDAVLFANFETFAVKDKAKRIRGVSSGSRIIYTQRTASYDAKDRYGLPPQMPLSWAEFEKAKAAGQPADPDALIAEITRKAALLGGKDSTDTLAAVAKIGGDAIKLSQLNSWVNAKLNEVSTPTK